MKKLIVFAIVILLAMLIYNTFLFTVDETNTAVVMQFQEIVKIAKEPGLYTKIPFIQSVVYLEDRLLSYDIQPRELYTSDQKKLYVDNYAIWKIEDPVKFIESMNGGNLSVAQIRIDDIVYSNLRNKLATHTFDEIVSEKRAGYLTTITKKSEEELLGYGIDLIDVKIKRADLPKANESAVFQRMSSEREQEAKEIRAEGEKEAQILRAEAEKEARIIVAQANMRAQELRGEGDAMSLQIYNEAYSVDPDFYYFWRTLASYEKSLDKDTIFILDDGLDYLNQLKSVK